jgi:hypothetical protein
MCSYCAIQAAVRRACASSARWTSALMTRRNSSVVRGGAERRSGVPNGIRTRVAAVKGRCPRPLDDRDAWAAEGREAEGS